MPVCDCMLMYVLYVSVLEYCPTYCAGCLIRGRGCLGGPAPDSIGWSIQSRRTLKYTLVSPHKCFNK